VRESRDHEAEDRKQRELAEARNTGDNLAYQTEKTLRDLGAKIPAGDRSNIESKVNALREALKSSDIARIKSLSDDLQNAFHAISQQLYAQQGQPAPQGGDGRGPEGEGEVVEGEFHEA